MSDFVDKAEAWDAVAKANAKATVDVEAVRELVEVLDSYSPYDLPYQDGQWNADVEPALARVKASLEAE